MSINHFLDQGIEPQSWTNLYVNSLKTKSLSFALPTSGTIQNIYLDPAGSDSNSGITALSPVLTFQKAIDIAGKYSAEQCVFNLQGTGNISGFKPCGSCSQVDALLDFRPLVTNYSHILIKGYRVDEVVVGAGVAGENFEEPNGKFIQLTNFVGLGVNAYSNGFIYDGEKYDIVYGNQATFINSTRPTGFAAKGFTLYNLGAVQLYSDDKWGIASFLPVEFQDVILVSPVTPGNYIDNVSLLPIKMFACHLKSQKTDSMLKGFFDLNGCCIEGTDPTKNYGVIFEDSILELHNCQTKACQIKVSDIKEWRDIYSLNTKVIIESGTYDIQYWSSSNNDGINLDLAESQGILDEAILTNTHNNINSPIIRAISSSLTSNTYIKISKPTPTSTAGDCVLFINKSSLRINKNCTIDAQADFAIRLTDDSSLILTPAGSGTNIIKSFSKNAITIQTNSVAILNPQNPRNQYEITSASVNCMSLLNNSYCLVNAPQGTGPYFYYNPGHIADLSYNSKIQFASGNYKVNGIGANGSVLLGAGTVINTSDGAGSVSGSAIDVPLTGALDAGQNCTITIQ